MLVVGLAAQDEAIFDDNQLCSYSNLVSVEFNYVGLDCNKMVYFNDSFILPLLNNLITSHGYTI